MGGYQLADRDGHLPRPLSREPRAPEPRYPPSKVAAVPLRAAARSNHVFLPGHRIMVQIQSSWFPLYDRNPQTYVDNIFFARPGDYTKATQRVYHGGGASSFVSLPVVEAR